MRTRTRGPGFSAVPTRVINQINGGCSQKTWTTVATDNNVPLVGSLERMSDVVTPGFNVRRRKGEIIFNPMQHDLKTVVASAGAGIIQTRNSPVNCDGDWRQEQYDVQSVNEAYVRVAAAKGYLGEAIDPESLMSSTEINRAIIEASTQALANRGSSDSNLWESIAESDQLLHIHTQSMENFHRIFSKIPKKALSGATNAYLLYRYGIRPVIADVNNVVKGIKQVAQTVRRTSRGYSDLNLQSTSILDVNYDIMNYKFTVNTSDQLSVRAMSLDEYYLSRANAIGFTSKGLLTLPWELIPYSFVVDYFVNVGDFLKALAPTPGLTNLGSALTMTRTRITTWSALSTVSTNAGWTCSRPVSGGVTSTIRSKSRGGLVQPGIAIKSDFRLSNLDRALDLTALAVQRLLGTKR